MMRLFLVLLLATVLVLVQSTPDRFKRAEDDFGEDQAPDEPPEEDDTPGAEESDLMLTPEQQEGLVYAEKEEDEREQAADDSTMSRKKRKALSNLVQRWPNAIVPYIIDRSLFQNKKALAAIANAVKHWEANTCLKVKPVDATVRSQAGHSGAVRFFKGYGCWSRLGRVTSKGYQNISIGTNCEYTGTVAHEIGHAIGFFHEQARFDRDKEIVVMEQNIAQGKASQFRKYKVTAMHTHDVPYDVSSLMHYGSKYFLRRGLQGNTIQTLDPNKQNIIGNRKGLSFQDVKLANIIYKCNDRCSSGQKSQKCMNSGYVGPQCKCVCPGLFGGSDCSQIIIPKGWKQCAGTQKGKYFNTPNYPKNYPNNQDCYWKFEVPKGKRARVHFYDFMVEAGGQWCAYDNVEVYAGDTKYHFCHTGPPRRSITSDVNWLVVHFKSDARGQSKGFKGIMDAV